MCIWVIYSFLPAGPCGPPGGSHTDGQFRLLFFLRGDGEGRAMARGPCPSPRPTCLGRLSSGSRTPHRSGTFCPALPSATPALPQHSAEAPFSPQSSLTLHSRSRLPLCGFAGPCPPPSPRHECHQLIPRATSSLFVKFGPQMDTFLESHVSADAPHVPRLFKAPPAPSRVIFCLYLLLSLLTASHRQRLQCIQNKSFQPTFQCL